MSNNLYVTKLPSTLKAVFIKIEKRDTVYLYFVFQNDFMTIEPCCDSIEIETSIDFSFLNERRK